jgi:hypothetical protein
MPRKRRRIKKVREEGHESVLRPEYEKAFQETVKKFDGILRELSKL